MKNLTFKAAMLNDSRTTVERRSTDGQSQRHYKQTPLSKRWKVLTTLVLLFTLALGNAWGDTTYNLIEGGSLNTDHFSTAGTLKNADSNHLNKKGVGFGSSGYTTLTSIQKTDRFIRYDCKTDDVTISVEAVNGNSSTNKNFTIFVVSEDGTLKYTKTTSIATKKTAGSDSYHVTDPNASLYVSTNSTDVWVTQITVTESGNSNKRGGQAGYALNLYKGRFAGTSGVANLFDGMTITPSSDYTLGTSEYLRFKSKSIAFNISERVAVALTATNEKKVIIAQNSTATTPEYTSVANGTIKKTLGKTGDWYILGKEDIYLTNMEFIPVYTITYAANGGGGSMNTTNDTVGYQGETMNIPACTFTAPSGYEFDGWAVTGVVGKTELDDEGSFSMPNNVVTLTAQWKEASAKYTVIYKDGTTELKNVMVNVGSAPDAYSPTKDCYTFAAWQKNAVDYDPAKLASDAEANQTYTLTARWTPVYASGTYNFEGKSVTTSTTEASVVDGALYFSAVSATLDTGDPLYYGWKLKTLGATVKFLVQNNSAVKVTLKEKSPLNVTYTPLEGTETTEAAAKSATKTVNVKGGTIVTLTTTTDATTTLNKIEIIQLYTATRVDEMNLVGGEDNNVTEVTLPTPSPTTKEGKNFTGWKANQIVTVDDVAVAAYTLIAAGKTAVLGANTTFTAQWVTPSDFDVKFFQGYGDPDVQIGDKQTISTGNFAVAPADPTRTGFAFLGWSYDATAEHIVTVSEYPITAETNFRAMWKAVWTVTFDGEGAVNVEDGETVASPNSPTQAGKVFQGWYNGESKYDFSAAVTGNLALISKWADADANHFYYNYKDDFHYDGVVYKSPEGKVDNKDGESNKAITTPYTLFSGAAGISSIVATKAIYDSKSNWVNAYLKINTSEDSYLTFTIASGYTAVLKMKMGGYSSDPTITLKKGEETIAATSGTPGGKQASKENDFNEIVYDLVAGTYTMTTATKTLYISHIDLEATALPTFTVTYVPGEGTGDEVVDNDATMVADCPAGFTAPTGKAFNGWKDGDNNDVEVGATVTESMTLTAQWINQYAVTFDMQGHGTAVDPQYIKHGAKATKPADPFVMGWDFGGWFTEATCENEFDFNTAIEAATPLFAKWTEFIGCTMLYPAKSGDAIAVGEPIVMQDGSFGGAMSALAIPDGGALTYNNNGLQFATKTGVKANVVLNNDIVAGTKIILTLVAGGEKTRGLFLYTKDGDKIDDFTCWVDGVNPASNGLEDTFTYTVQAGDGLAGTNEFQLWRNNTVYLKSLKVSSCGDAIIYHDLTSEVNIAGKGTVTLGANTVREGHTTTATYSDIDPLYEFVSWSVSGTGANIENATANPATITMGTEDAVVTLNLKVKPVKFTVNYYDGTTLKGTEEVTVNEYPTASEVVTAKRHFTFQGWSTTDGGSVVALNTITSDVAATISLYAVYAPVACPTEGAVFSMEFDPAKTPESTVKALRNGGVVELSEYATISGGDARIINNETGSDKDAITTSGQFKLTANGEVMKIELDCAIATGDVIRIPDNNQKYILSTKADKTGTYQSQTSSQHEFEATAAWNGVDDLYILYDGSSLNFTKVYVLRPYTVSFDLQGHGDAIDAQKLVAGKKVEAPTAPTADGWDFGGWYKEAACTNAWDFDNDVVDGTATLFAKWSEHVYNDATLKSLTYGGEEIALEDGIYEYNIELPALTTAVPALAAETNSALATRLITNAESFDGDGKATSTVKVTSEDHTVELTYTVNFTKIAAVELQDVTGDFTWDFSKAVSAEKTVPTTLTVLANIYGVANNADFKSDNLMGASGKMKTGFAQVKTLKFHATVPGKLTVVFSNTGNKEYDRILYINGVATTAKSKNQTPVTYNVVVPAGDVLIQGWETKENPEDETWNMLNFYSMDFDVDLDPTKTGESTLGGYERDVTEGRYGTICLPKAGVMVGATIYTLAYYGETSQKIFFDEVVDGTMEAGKPYLFLPNEGVDRIGVYYTNQTTKTAQTVNGFVGYIGASEDDYTQVPAGDGNYIVQNNQYREILAGATAYILSHRAYIHFAGINTSEPAKAPGARRIGISGAPQVATGMDALNTAEAPVKVMIDGQLFILRGEKMYDATGRLVK